MSTKKKTKKPENFLLEKLLDLQAVSAKGFEGLIQRLLENLTGDQFYIAKSGYQAGKDISNKYNAIECKRYGESTRLDETELLGKMEQALIDNPSLEMWILATTRSVDSQLNDKLEKKAHRDGVEYTAIESGDGEPSSLEVLCAAFEDVVLNVFKYADNEIAINDIKKLKDYLTEVKRKKEYKKKLFRLRDTLSRNYVGFDRWRKEGDRRQEGYQEGS
jgi:hypothetical protein